MENETPVVETITGYQWGDSGAYIGPYSFDAVVGAVHMPPRTTLTAPPAQVPSGQEPAWDNGSWVLREKDTYWLPAVIAGSAGSGEGGGV